MVVDWQDFGEYLDGWHKYTGYAMANCVFHDDTNPSMSISPKGYYCKSCRAHGSLEKLYDKVANNVRLVKQKSPNPSAWIWKRWEERFGSVKVISAFAHQNLKSNPDLGHYLYKRGLDAVSIEKGQLGFMEGYYIFPIRDDNGEVQGAVARASPTIQTKKNRYSVSFGCPVHLYVPDWAEVKKAEALYICYGTLDAWSLDLAGYPAITGISGQELNASYLSQFRVPMFGIADVGEHGSMVALRSGLGWRMKVLKLDYPDGCKDLNDIHVKYGLDALRETIEKKKELIDAR